MATLNAERVRGEGALGSETARRWNRSEARLASVMRGQVAERTSLSRRLLNRRGRERDQMRCAISWNPRRGVEGLSRLKPAKTRGRE